MGTGRSLLLGHFHVFQEVFKRRPALIHQQVLTVIVVNPLRCEFSLTLLDEMSEICYLDQCRDEPSIVQLPLPWLHIGFLSFILIPFLKVLHRNLLNFFNGSVMDLNQSFGIDHVIYVVLLQEIQPCYLVDTSLRVTHLYRIQVLDKETFLIFCEQLSDGW